MSCRETFLLAKKMRYGGLAHEPHYSMTPRTALSDQRKARTADIAPQLVPNLRLTAEDPLKTWQPISCVDRRFNAARPFRPYTLKRGSEVASVGQVSTKDFTDVNCLRKGKGK